MLQGARAATVESLRAGGTARLRVVSRSMSPTVPNGSWVIVATCTLDTLRPGDVVALDAPNAIAIHRLLTIRHVGGEPKLMTRGDAEWLPDAPWASSALLGRVTAVEGASGKSSSALGGRSSRFYVCLARAALPLVRRTLPATTKPGMRFNLLRRGALRCWRGPEQLWLRAMLRR